MLMEIMYSILLGDCVHTFHKWMKSKEMWIGPSGDVFSSSQDEVGIVGEGGIVDVGEEAHVGEEPQGIGNTANIPKHPKKCEFFSTSY